MGNANGQDAHNRTQTKKQNIIGGSERGGVLGGSGMNELVDKRNDNDKYLIKWKKVCCISFILSSVVCAYLNFAPYMAILSCHPQPLCINDPWIRISVQLLVIQG